MGVQSAINQGLGAITAGVTSGKVLKNQSKVVESQKMAAGEAVLSAHTANEEAKVAESAAARDEAAYTMTHGKTREEVQAELGQKSQDELNKITEFDARHGIIGGDVSKSSRGVKAARTRQLGRIDAARKAFEDLTDEINSRNLIKQNFINAQNRLNNAKTTYTKLGGKI